MITHRVFSVLSIYHLLFNLFLTMTNLIATILLCFMDQGMKLRKTT